MLLIPSSGKGLKVVLAADIEVVGEAENGKEALDKVRQLAPEVVLMDIAMPIMDGLEATGKIRKASINRVFFNRIRDLKPYILRGTPLLFHPKANYHVVKQ